MFVYVCVRLHCQHAAQRTQLEVVSGYAVIDEFMLWYVSRVILAFL